MAKKRKISVRKILQVFLTLVVTAACVVAMVSASKIDDNTTLKSVAVHIKNDKKYHFIEQKEIMDLAINNRNIDIIHTPLSKLDIHQMEQVILADPWVADAQVYVDNARMLHMYVTQRIPVARIFQQSGGSCYMDTTLSTMPLSANYIYYTTVVTNVPELKNDSAGRALRKQIVSLVRTIQADSFWSAQISQVIVDSGNTFELVPVLGDQRILFGDATGMNDKFNNLFTFYKNVLNHIGWDKYEVLDLRYNGQIIASPSLPYKGPVDKAVVNMNWINSLVESEAEKDEKDSLRMAAAKDINGAGKAVSAPRQVLIPVKQKVPVKAKPVQKPVVNGAAKKVVKKTDKKKQAKKPQKKVTKPGKAEKKAKNAREKNKKRVSPKYIYHEKKDH
jgi:cell division protein FtsQ